MKVINRLFLFYLIISFANKKSALIPPARLWWGAGLPACRQAGSPRAYASASP